MSSQILLLLTLGSKDRKQRKETDLKSASTDPFLRSFPLLGEKEH